MGRGGGGGGLVWSKLKDKFKVIHRITHLKNSSFDFRRVLTCYLLIEIRILDVKVQTDFFGCSTDNDAYLTLYIIKDRFVTQVYIHLWILQ